MSMVTKEYVYIIHITNNKDHAPYEREFMIRIIQDKGRSRGMEWCGHILL